MYDLEKQTASEPYLGVNTTPESDVLSAQARIGFIKKVYGILCVQLLLTVLVCVWAMNSQAFQLFQVRNLWLFFVAAGVAIVVMLCVTCLPSTGRRVPYNYLLLTTFTLAEAYLVSFSCVLSNGNLVLTAAFMTAAVVVALTVYAMTTKSDFTMMGGILFIVGAVLLVLVLVNFFVQSTLFDMLISAAFAVLFGVYLIYDTQLIIGTKQNRLDLDEYIYGALILYVDIIGLFQEILNLLGFTQN